MKRVLPTLAVLLLLAPPAAGQKSEKEPELWERSLSGEAAYARGNYAAALDEFFPLAEQGDALAQYRLGLMYLNGQGVPQNYLEASKWAKKAAKQGMARAQNLLGGMYTGGQGVPENYVLAAEWYRKAAAQGYTKAQAMLGAVYLEGRGVPQDYVQAHKWFNLAGAQGHKGATQSRDYLAERMTPEQIAEAQKLAREWREKYGE